MRRVAFYLLRNVKPAIVYVVCTAEESFCRDEQSRLLHLQVSVTFWRRMCVILSIDM